ncbi:hypothetical protein GUITHDRAFT_136509 [Guillardia theta CCMP2712]|uniref:Uncharacterized protein n=1 Tax=Guillardia theta (strain CCMP2712) TaxID=905079 RepID=L1JK14_GUITC|nr:hypothetical protein GUITHDRAFT_136509 [Guillardia theta CCMP2712]EKX48853.1 hypothetical protein GUITHDRAFT_136509 [Guillardia theta CCMP2712]|eukprot:XP_005835833.1 hypothetical protein GUITHDRAFT_136509 [Guillardia theta CCMP2712]
MLHKALMKSNKWTLLLTQYGTQLVVTSLPFELQGSCAGGSPFCDGSTCYGTACVTPGAGCMTGCLDTQCGNCLPTNTGAACRSAAQCTGSNPLLSSNGLTSLIPGSSHLCQIISVNETLFGGKSFGPISVALKDPSFKTVTTASGIPVSVQLMGCRARCDLVGQTVQIMSYGEAVFDSLKILQVGASYSLRFQLEQTCTISSCIPHGILATSISFFDVIPGQLSYLSIDVFPQQAIANSDFNPSPTISTRDAGGNIIPLRMQITVSKGARGDGVAIFSRNGLNYRFSDQGVAVFSGIFVSIVSVYDVVFNTSIGNISFAVTYSGLVVTGSEQFLTISNSFPNIKTYASLVPFEVQPSIVVTDQRGSVVESSQLIVEAWALDGQTQALQAMSGSSRLQFVKGVVRFTDLSIGRAGVGYKVRFQSGAISVTTANSFDVIPGQAASIEVVRQPAVNWTAGEFSYLNPRIRLLDRFSNVIVQGVTILTYIQSVGSIANSLPSAVFTSNISQAQYADQGFVEIANLHLEIAGRYELVLTIGNISNVSSSFEVFPAAIFELFIARQPFAGVVGSALQPAPLVELHDRFGNTIMDGISSFSCSAILQSNPTGATLMCSGSFPCLENFVNGQAKFASISLNNAGKGYQLLFTAQIQTGNGIIAQLTASSQLFDVSGLVSSALVTLPASNLQCGQVFDVLVTLMDVYGNTVRASQDGVAVEMLSVTDGKLLSIQGTTIVLARNGVADFTNLIVGNVGESFQFVFSCNVSKINIRSQTFAVWFGRPSSIQLLVSPAVSRVGEQMMMELMVVDVCSSIVLGFNSNASFSLVDDNKQVHMLGVIQLISGQAILAFNLSTIGQDMAILSYASSFNVSGVSNSFSVSFGVIASLHVETVATSAVALVPLSPGATLSARDAGGNLVTDFGGDVLARKLSGSSADSNLVGVTQVAAAQGMISFFDLQITTLDTSFRIEFLYWNVSSSFIVRTSSPPIVVTGSVAELRLISIAENAAGGRPFGTQPALAVFDQFGSTVLSYSRYARVQANDTIADPLLGTTSIAFQRGRAFFTDLQLSLASSARVLLFSTDGLSVKQVLTVQQGTPTALVVVQGPVDSFGFKVFQQSVSVKVVDQGLNAVSSTFSCAISLTNGNSALLSGTLRKLTSNGIASFTDIRIDSAGFGFALNFSCSSQDGTLSLYKVSSPFRLYGSAVALSLYRFPAGAIADASFSPAVELRLLDETYNHIPVIESLDCTASAVGNLVFSNGIFSVRGAFGIANFSDIRVSFPTDSQISGKQILFKCQYKTSCFRVMSPFFSITYAVSQISILSPPSYSLVMAGEVINPPPLLQALDSLGRIVYGSSSAVKVSLIYDNSIIAGLQGTLSTQFNAGVSNFTDLFLSTTGGPYTLKFEIPGTSTTIPPVYVSILNVTNGPARSLQLVTQPLTVAADTVFSVQPCLGVNDGYSNLAVVANAQVSVDLIASNSSFAVLGGDTIVQTHQGYATFTNLQIQNVSVDETFMLRFTLLSSALPSHPSVSVTSNAVKVLLGFVQTISFVRRLPPALVSAQPHQLYFRASDVANNSLTQPCNLTITLVPLSSDYNATNVSRVVNNLNPSNGVFQVNVTVNQVGRYLMFLSINRALSPPSEFLVLQGQPCCLRLLSQPRDTMIGKTIVPAPQIIAVDAGGNSIIRTGLLVNVSLSNVLLPTARLDGNTSVQMQENLADFTDLSVNLAGSGFSLVFVAENLQPALSSSFIVTGTVSNLEIQITAIDRIAGAPWLGQPQVLFRDNDDSRISCDCIKGSVLVSLYVDGKASSALEGTKQLDVHKDVVYFTDLSIKLASSKLSLKFVFTPVGYGNPIVNFSRPFEVIAGRASNLVVVSEMDSSLRGIAPGKQPVVAILDAFSNVVLSFVGALDVKLSKSTEDKGVLNGHTTAAFINGTASFTDLSITPVSGSSAFFVLLFSSSGFAVSSTPVEIVSGPIATIVSKVVTLGSILQMNGLLQPQPQIAAVDTSGGVVTDFDGDSCNSAGCFISVAISGASSSLLGGQTSVKAQAGVATFTDLRIAVNGTYALVFSANALWGSTVFSTVQSNVVVSSISALEIEVPPALAVNGQMLRRQPTLRIVSSSASSTVLASSHLVTARLVSSSTCKGLGSPSALETTVRAQQGRAVFSNISIFAESGFCSLQFLISLADNASEPFLSVNSQPIYIMQNSPSLILQSQPSNESGGLPFHQQPQLVAQQLDGKILAGNGFVTASLVDSNGRVSMLRGSTKVLFYSNVVTFTNLAIDRVGRGYRLLFTYMDISVWSDPFQVVNGSIASLFLLQQPTHVHAGVSFSQPVTACAKDAGGNDAIIQASNNFAATLVYLNLASLHGSTATTQENNCVIFSSLAIDTPAKEYRLKISETSTSISVISDKFDVHGDVAHLVLDFFPAKNFTAGQVLEPKAVLLLSDNYGIRAWTSRADVSLALQMSQGNGTITLPATAFDGGATTCEIGLCSLANITIFQAHESLVLSFAIGSSSVSSPSFSITAGPVASLHFVQVPAGSQFLGVPLLPFPVIEALDKFSNRVYGTYTVSSCFQIVNQAAGPNLTACHPDQSFSKNCSAGMCRFDNLFLKTSHIEGGVSAFLHFYMNLTGSILTSLVSSLLSFRQSSPRLVITRTPSLCRSAMPCPQGPVVELQDAGGFQFNNLQGGFSFLPVKMQIAASSTNTSILRLNGVQCPCLVQLNQGKAIFDKISFDRPALFYSLQFSLDALGLDSILSDGFAVFGPVVKMDLQTTLQPRVALTALIDFTLQLSDANALPLPGVEMLMKTVAMGASDPTCVFLHDPLASLEVAQASNGSGVVDFKSNSFNTFYGCRLKVCFEAIDKTLVIDRFKLSNSVCSIVFDVVHDSPKSLLLAPHHSLWTSDDMPLDPFVVYARDQFNHTTNFSSAWVNLSISRGSEVLSQTFSQQLLSGAASFTLDLPRAGVYLLNFSLYLSWHEASNVTIFSLTIVPGGFDHLAVLQQPSNCFVMQTFHQPVIVIAQDRANNQIFDLTIDVVPSKYSGQNSRSLLQDTSAVPLADGQAIFRSLRFNDSDSSAVIKFSTESGCRRSVVSTSFAVSGLPAQASSVSQSTTAVASLPLAVQPLIGVSDAGGQRCFAFVGYVCANLTDQTLLKGNTTAIFQLGTAQFTDLSLTRVGTQQLSFYLYESTYPLSSINCLMSSKFTVVTNLQITVGQPSEIRFDTTRLFDLTQLISGVNPSVYPAVQMFDAGGNLISTMGDYGVQVTLLALEMNLSQIKLKTSTTSSLSIVTSTFVGEKFDCNGFVIQGTGFDLYLKLSLVRTDAGVVSLPSINPLYTNTFDVLIGVMNELIILQQPSGCMLNFACKQVPIVAIRDIGGNIVANDNSLVSMYNVDIMNSIAKFYWNDKLCESLTAGCSTSGVDGVSRWSSVRFDCTSCTGSVSQKLKFEATKSDRSQISVESDTFLVLKSEVNSISSNLNHVDCYGGKAWPLQPSFALLNVENYILTPFNGGSAFVEIVSRPTDCQSAKLLGNASVLFYNGIANFTDLAIDKQCISPYVVSFSFSVDSMPTGASLALSTNITVQVNTGDPYQLKITSFAPSGSDFYAGLPFTVSTQVCDKGGNPITSFTSNPTVKVQVDEDFVSNENLILQGQSCFLSCSLSYSQGLFTSDNLRINQAPSLFRLAITTTFPSNTFVISTIYTDYFQLKVGSASELRLVNHPQDSVSGDVLGDIALMLLDSGGNYLVTNSQFIVRVSVSSGSGSISGVLNATTSQGLAKFSQIVITLTDDICSNVLQSHILQFAADSGEFSTNSLPFIVSFPPSASDFLVSPPPYIGCGLISVPHVKIAVVDKCGFIVRSSMHEANVSAFVQDNALGCHLMHDINSKTDQGVATLSDLTLISQTGYCNVTFLVSTTALTFSLFKQIYVYPGSAAKLQMDVYHEPASTMILSGLPFPHQPKLYVKDAGNNSVRLNASQMLMAVLLSHNDISAANTTEALLGTTNINIQDGIALFTNLRVNQVGNFSLRFWFNGTFHVDSLPFQVSVGPIAQIVFTQQPISAIFNEEFSPSLQLLLLDLGGNPVRGTPWIKITSSPYSLSCSDCDSTGCYAYAAQNDGHVTFSGCKVPAGQPGDLTISARVAEPSIFGQAFAVTSRMIKMTGLPSLLQVSDLPLHVSAFNSSLALLPSQPQVQLLDSSLSPVLWNVGRVTLSLGKANGNDTLELHGTLSVPVIQGLASFTDVGTTGQGSNLSLIFQYNVSSRYLVIPPVLLPNFSFASEFPDVLEVHGIESSLSAGDTKNFSVQGKDTSGSVVSLTGKDIKLGLQVQNCTACVSFRSLLISSESLIVNDVVLQKRGSWNMTFTLSWNGKYVERTVGPLQVFAGKIGQLVIVNQPANSTVSVVIEPFPQVSLLDAHGNDVECNPAYDYSHSFLNVNLSSLSTGYYRLDGTRSLQATCQSSLLTFHDLSVNTSGSDFFLVFSMAVDSRMITATSAAFAVSSRTVEFMPLFSDLNLTWTAGTNYSLEFLALDSDRKVSYSKNTSMRVALGNTPTNLYGVKEINASAVFLFNNLSVMQVGNFNLTFSLLVQDQLSYSKFFLLTVIPGQGHQLVIDQSPAISDNQAGVAFSWQPILRVMDAAGNEVSTAYTVSVSLDVDAAQYSSSSGLEFSPALSSLTGNRVKAAAGRIVFTDLLVDKAATSYKLLFASAGLPSASSSFFNVSIGAPDNLKVSQQPLFLVANRPASFLVTTHDKGGNFVPSNVSFTVTAALALSPFQSASSVLDGVLQQNVHDGRAFFDDVIFKVAGAFFRLRLSSPGLTSATSRAFAVISSFSSAACTASTTSYAPCGLPEENAMSLVLQSSGQKVAANESLNISSILKFIDTMGRSQSPVCSSMFYTVRRGGLLVDAQSHSLGGCSSLDGQFPCNSLRVLLIGTYDIRFTLSCSGILYQSPTLNLTVLPQVPCCLHFQTPPPSRVVQHDEFSSQLYLTDAYGNPVNDSILIHADVVDILANSKPFTFSAQPMEKGSLSFVGMSFSSPGVYHIRFLPASSGAIASPAAVTVEAYASSVPASISFSASPVTAIAKYASQDLSNKKNFYLDAPPRLQLKDSLGNQVNIFRGVVKLFLSSSNTNFKFTGDTTSLFFLPSQDLKSVNLQAARASSTTSPVTFIASAQSCQTCSKLFDVESNQIYVSDYVSQVDLGLSRSGFPAGDPVEVVTSITDAAAKVFCGQVTFAQMVYFDPMASTSVVDVQNFDFSGIPKNHSCGQSSLSLSIKKNVGAYPLKVVVCLQGLFEPCFWSRSLLLNVSLGRAVGFQLVRGPDQTGSINLGGSAFVPQPVLQAVDFGGNAVGVQQAATVRADLIGAGQSQLLGNRDCSVSANGTCAFTNMAIDRAGMGYQISFSGSLFNTSILSKPFNVAVGPSSKVRLLQAPLNNSAGVPLVVQPLAAVTDAGGNWVNEASVQMEIGFCCQCDTTPTNCSLRGNKVISTLNGVADFTDLVIARTGAKIPILFRLLPVSVACSSVRFPLDCSTSCCSSTGSVTVTEGPPAALVLQDQPAVSQQAGVVFSAQPSVQLVDAGGNAVLGSNKFTVTAVLVTGSQQVEMLGSTTLVATLGRVVFTDLRTMKEASSYTLTFRVYQDGVAINISVSSSTFAVSTGQPAALIFDGIPSKRPAGTALSTFPSVKLVDAGGNRVILPSAKISYWLQSSCQQSVIVGDVQQSSSIAYTWTSSINYPCSSSRLVASVSSYPFIALSKPFVIDVGGPADFLVVQTMAYQIVVKWQNPPTGPAPSTYLIEYSPFAYPNGTEVFISSMTISSQSTTATLTALDPKVLYNISVCSRSVYATQPACSSDSLSLFSAPIASAANLTVEHVDESSAFISWYSPSLGLQPPSYRVIQRCVDNRTCGEMYNVDMAALTFVTSLSSYVSQDRLGSSLPGTKLSYLITNLTSGRGYTFEVRSQFAAPGNMFSPSGPVTQTIYPTATANSLSFKVECVAPCNNPPTMKLSWTAAPDENSRVVVNYLSIVAPPVTSPFTSTGEYSFPNSTLVRGAFLFIQLLTQNVPSKLDMPVAQISYRLVSRPAPPFSLAVVIVSNDLFFVSWLPPIDVGDGTRDGVPILGYNVKCKRADATVLFDTTVGREVLNVTISSLQRGETYEVSVTVTTKKNLLEGGEQFVSEPATVDQYMGYLPVLIPSFDAAVTYDAFIGVVFSRNLTAQDMDINQTLEVVMDNSEGCLGSLLLLHGANPVLFRYSFLPKVSDSGKMITSCFLARDSQGLTSSRLCILLRIASPSPSFLPLAGALPLASALPAHVKGEFLATAGCSLAVTIAGADGTSAGISPAEASILGYELRMKHQLTIITSAAGTSLTLQGLPPGAEFLGSDMVWANPVERNLLWKPARGQDSLKYDFCFILTDSSGISTTGGYGLLGGSDFCLRISVSRCKYCIQEGESLYDISHVWRTTWLNLWSGNEQLVHPALPGVGTELLLGQVYKALASDTLQSLSAKFMVTIDDLVFWNPDLAVNVSLSSTDRLVEGQAICILPKRVCVLHLVQVEVAGSVSLYLLCELLEDLIILRSLVSCRI